MHLQWFSTIKSQRQSLVKLQKTQCSEHPQNVKFINCWNKKGHCLAQLFSHSCHLLERAQGSKGIVGDLHPPTKAWFGVQSGETGTLRAALHAICNFCLLDLLFW